MQYIEKFGEDSGVYNNMAYIYENNIQDYEKALQYFDKSIELFSEDAAISYSNKAKLLYYKLGKVEEAIESFNKSVELDSENDVNFYFRGEFFEEQGNYEMALKDYIQAKELNPDVSDYYFRMAYCYDALDQYDKSLSTYLSLIHI